MYRAGRVLGRPGQQPHSVHEETESQRMRDIDSNQGEGVNTLSYTSRTTSPLAFASHDLCLKTVGPKPFPLEDKLISTVLT